MGSAYFGMVLVAAARPAMNIGLSLHLIFYLPTLAGLFRARQNRKIVVPARGGVFVVPPFAEIVAEAACAHRGLERRARAALLGRDGAAAGIALDVEAVEAGAHVD